MKQKYAVHVIPDHGDPQYRSGFEDYGKAMFFGKKLARQMLKLQPKVTSVEVTVVTVIEEYAGTELIGRQ